MLTRSPDLDSLAKAIGQGPYRLGEAPPANGDDVSHVVTILDVHGNEVCRFRLAPIEELETDDTDERAQTLCNLFNALYYKEI